MSKTKPFKYRLDFVTTRIINSDGTYKDLPVDEFIVLHGFPLFHTEDEANCCRINLSKHAIDGYYKVVKVN